MLVRLDLSGRGSRRFSEELFADTTDDQSWERKIKATFWEYFVPIYGAFVCGQLLSYSMWALVPYFVVTVLQIYILDRRDPNGIFYVNSH